MSINVSFNGVSLQTATILIDKIDGYDNIPERKIYDYFTARTDGSKVVAVYFSKKTLTISGKIIGTSVTNLDSQIDTLRGNIVAQEANLDFDWNGSTRRFISTLASSKIVRATNGIYATFTLTFECAAAYGQDTASSTLLGGTVLTTTGVNTAITVSGNAQFQQPIITLTINSLTASSVQSMTISNPVGGTGITVTRTWSAADVLVINNFTKAVTVGGVATDYTGAFPTWIAGSGNIRYADTFTLRNVTLAATYTKLWV